MVDNIVQEPMFMDETTPICIRKPNQFFTTRRKTNSVILQKDMFNRAGSKIITSRIYQANGEKEFGFDIGVYENKREDERLPNQ